MVNWLGNKKDCKADIYIGSLNLSNSGMKNNLETSILIKDKEFVKQISSKIDDLYNDCGRGEYSDTDIINIFSIKKEK